MNTLLDFNFSNQRVLIRVDFNVPLNDDLQITDKTRIEAALPTIKYLINCDAKVILMSHLGRPKNKEHNYSLMHIVKELGLSLKTNVHFIDDCIGEKVQNKINQLIPGEVLLLENLRYYDQEKKGDFTFAKELSKLADYYVNDAFGTAHRSHASTAVIAQFFNNKKCFGFLLENEIKQLSKVIDKPEKPLTAIIGGSKVSTKITVIENILKVVDHLIIGGGMTFTFIKALGGQIGDSICEDDKLSVAKDILKSAKKKPC